MVSKEGMGGVLLTKGEVTEFSLQQARCSIIGRVART